MKAQRIKRYLIVILLLGFSGSGSATPCPNPFPGIWSDDIDGNGQLQGATDVDVNGTFYDLDFIGGSFFDVFG